MKWSVWFDNYSKSVVDLFSEIAATIAFLAASIAMFNLTLKKGNEYLMLVWLGISIVFLFAILLRRMVVGLGVMFKEQKQSNIQIAISIVVLFALSVVPTAYAATLILSTLLSVSPK